MFQSRSWQWVRCGDFTAGPIVPESPMNSMWNLFVLLPHYASLKGKGPYQKQQANHLNHPPTLKTRKAGSCKLAVSSKRMSRFNPGPLQPIPSMHSLSSSCWTFRLHCDVLELPRDYGKDGTIKHGQPPSTQMQTVVLWLQEQTLRLIRRKALELDWFRFTFECHFGHFTCVTLGTLLLCLLVCLHWSGNTGDSSFWRLPEYFKVIMCAFLLAHVSILF